MHLKSMISVKDISLRRRLTAMILTILLGSSIMTAVPTMAQEEDPLAQIDGKTQGEIIDSVCDVMNRIYVDNQMAQEMERKVRKAFKDGKYKDLTDRAEFAQRLYEDMNEICHDGHFGIRYVPNMDPAQYQDFDSLPPDEQERIRRENLIRLQHYNYNFEKLEILPGNIGYFKFDGFTDASLGGEKAIAAMNFLSDVDALIIDLRENGGGSPSMIQLITSYFYDNPVHLNSFFIREDSSYQQFWTQAHVEGPRMSDVDLYVLTSEYTFSGAEEFSYNLKNLERATLIGETTGGGAHPVSAAVFPNLGIVVRVPFGRAINPISKTNWEGVGVEPDIKVPADQALDVAREIALEKLAKREDNHPMVQRILDWELELAHIRANPYIPDEGRMSEYVGDYSPRHVFIEDDVLFYQRDERPKFKMIPVGEDKFMLEGLDYFIMIFARDENGDIFEITGVYNDGHSDHTAKVK